jgi:hypothetical protein
LKIGTFGMISLKYQELSMVRPRPRGEAKEVFSETCWATGGAIGYHYIQIKPLTPMVESISFCTVGKNLVQQVV